jgi:hypothetical protein
MRRKEIGGDEAEEEMYLPAGFSRPPGRDRSTSPSTREREELEPPQLRGGRRAQCQ